MTIHQGYEAAGSGCANGPAPGARGAMAWFLGAYQDQGGKNLGIYNCRSIRGGSTPSMHSEGRAVDFGINPHGAKYGTQLAEQLRLNSEELGIQCIIWNRRIWSGKKATWLPYGGSNPHVDHLHVSLTRGTARKSKEQVEELWDRVLSGDLRPTGGTIKPIKKKVVAIAGKAWPQGDLAVTNAHTDASTRAWVDLMDRVGYKDTSLGKNLQLWLKKLGYYKRAVDGDFGKFSVQALQQFLKFKKLYSGLVDGDRGPMTVKSEIGYLNYQGGLIRAA